MPRKIPAVLALATACFLAGYVLGTDANGHSGAYDASTPGAILLGAGERTALPPGHPRVSRLLPDGHPPVVPGLPEGHPPIGGACPYAGQRTAPGMDRPITTRRAPEPLAT